MKSKRTLRLWQMCIILGMEVVFMVTMFLPAIRINGDSYRKGMDIIFSQWEDSEDFKKMMENVDESVKEEYEKVKESSMEEESENFEKKIREFEERFHVKISNVSPVTIMTKSFMDLISGSNYKEEELREYEKDESYQVISGSYNKLRTILWIVYGLALIVLIFTLISFLTKLIKYIPLGVQILHGILATAVFAYLRFGLVRSIVQSKVFSDMVIDSLKKEISGEYFLDSLSDVIFSDEMVSVIFKKVLSAFYSYGFIVAFGIGIAILLAGILFMFLGGQTGVVIGENNEVSSFGESGFGPILEPTPPIFEPTPPVFEPKPPVVKPNPVPAAEMMGRVRITKGVAMGNQGLMIPQDRKVVVGKSTTKANLVVNNQTISNIHCSIRYNAAHNSYVIKDHSTNGTYVNGVRLANDIPMEYPAGTVLVLADGQTELTLG